MSSPARATSAVRAASTPHATSSGPSSRSILGQKRVLSDSEGTSETEVTRVKKPETIAAENVDRKRDKKRRRRKKRKLSIIVAGEEEAQESVAIASGSGSRRSHSTQLVTPTTTSALPLDLLQQPPATPAAPQSLSDPLTCTKSSSSEMASSNDKGKGRVSEETELLLPPNPSTENPSLAAQLSAKTNLLGQHEALLSTFQQTLTCQVCLDLMHRPYALTPCGHTACYSCLVSWFSTPPPDVPAGEVLPIWVRRKTCPHCRAVVRERPVLMWGIRDLVSALSKSGLGSGLPPPPPPDAIAEGEADPWANIFRPARSNMHASFAWPGAGAGAGAGEPPLPHLVGMHDAEDGGIYRCVDCMHEIWDGICSACGRFYPGNPGAGNPEDDMWPEEMDVDEEQHIMAGHIGQLMGGLGHILFGADRDDDDDEVSLTDEEDSDIRHYPRRAYASGGMAPFVVSEDDDAAHVSEHHGEDNGEDVNEDESEEDEEGYESSFIDDDDDRGIPTLRSRGGRVQARRVVDIPDTDDEELMFPALRQPPDTSYPRASGSRYRLGGRRIGDPDDEGGAEHPPPGSVLRSSRERLRAVFTDSEDNGEGDDDLAAEVAERERDLYGDDGSVPRSRRITVIPDEDTDQDEDFVPGFD
ncbi:hypothetical protein OBBRIDRAFT_790921 [Obba rivulosa]|uniref:RING-type domain-containing protein n=1 Tax=Obba rivulosa TaxID=1052685 RepID=A0A8E2AX84_9APHY|nr:hypothetical protein OBBRIDRAFT_790921 [Obba rivulosa]